MITETMRNDRPRDWEYIFKKLKEQGIDIAELEQFRQWALINNVIKTDFVTPIEPGINKGITQADAPFVTVDQTARDMADAAQSAAGAAQDTADDALPKTDVVAPDGSATTGQAADAAALNTILAGLVKLASSATQELFTNLALKTYLDGGQPKAFQLLGTALDGTEHTLIELAQYGAMQQIEIGSETIHLNLNNLGPVGGDNHITCDTQDNAGAPVKLSVAWLSDVVSQCAATLASANGYTDDEITQLHIDALILQDPCKESELPAGPFATSHNGYFYQITDFDVSHPGEDKKGSAVWYDSLDDYYLAVDTYKNADEDTITENSNGEFKVADISTGTVTADTGGGFANNVVYGFKSFIAAVIAKINGLFSLVSGLNTAVGGKQAAITATGTTNLLTAPASAGGQPGTKAVADFQPAVPAGAANVLLGPSAAGGDPGMLPLVNFDRNSTGSGLYSTSITDTQGFNINFSELNGAYASALGRARVFMSNTVFDISKYIEFEFYIFWSSNSIHVKQNYISLTARSSFETVQAATYLDNAGKLHLWIPMSKPAGRTIKLELESVKISPSSNKRASFDTPPVITVHSDNPYDDAPFKNPLVTITGPQTPIAAGASNVLLGPSTNGGQPGTVPLSSLQSLNASGEAEAEAMSLENPGATVWYPEGAA